MTDVSYYIDGVNFKDYGVFVESSDGLLSKPSSKSPISFDWPDHHGEAIDFAKIYFKARNISFKCFIVAESRAEFITKCNAFISLFDQSFTRRLHVEVDAAANPLLYEVQLHSGFDIDKTWNDSIMVGTFKLSLTEPEPVKKVYKYMRTGEPSKTVTFAISSAKSVNVYYGDKTHLFDVNGSNVNANHDYLVNGTYFIVITGDIDGISSITTNATLVWNKL